MIVDWALVVRKEPLLERMLRLLCAEAPTTGRSSIFANSVAITFVSFVMSSIELPFVLPSDGRVPIDVLRVPGQSPSRANKYAPKNNFRG